MAVDNLVEKHLEKEDQDIASKWRDDDKENNVQGKHLLVLLETNLAQRNKICDLVD